MAPYVLFDGSKRKTRPKVERARLKYLHIRSNNVVIGFGYSELLQRGLGLHIAVAVNAGAKKCLYQLNVLVPFWQGQPTLVIYVGSLLGMMLTPLMVISLE